jgi:hypothetical protein
MNNSPFEGGGIAEYDVGHFALRHAVTNSALVFWYNQTNRGQIRRIVLIFLQVFWRCISAYSPHLYDGTTSTTNSFALKNPVLYFTVNYRVGGFGFLAGKEMQANGGAKLALKDQRFALQRIQD